MSTQWPEFSLNEVLIANCTGYWGEGEASAKSPLRVQVLRNADIGKDGNLRGCAERYFSEKEAAKAAIASGDIVMSTSGDVGKMWLADSDQFCASNFVRVLRPNPTLVARGFMPYLLQTERLSALRAAYTRGATIANLQRDFFDAARFRLPPIEEQRRIVAHLDDVVSSLDAATVCTAEGLLRAHSLLDVGVRQILDEIKSHWPETTLGESCNFFNGVAHEQNIDPAGRFVVVNSRFIASRGKVRKFTGNQMFPLTEGDVTMVMSDVPQGKALARCFVIDKSEVYSLNQRICCVRSDLFEPIFLYYQLNRNPYLLAFDNKGSQANLRKGEILSCPLTLPSIEEQAEISGRLQALEIACRNLQAAYGRRSEILSKLRQSIWADAFAEVALAA